MGPFDDEETREFYCDIPDFLSMIPPALLGYSMDEVEKLRATNVLRFKSADSSAELEEVVNFNTETDAFSSSSDIADDNGAVSNDENMMTINADNDGDGKCIRYSYYTGISCFLSYNELINYSGFSQS